MGLFSRSNGHLERCAAGSMWARRWLEDEASLSEFIDYVAALDAARGSTGLPAPPSSSWDEWGNWDDWDNSRFRGGWEREVLSLFTAVALKIGPEGMGNGSSGWMRDLVVREMDKEERTDALGIPDELDQVAQLRRANRRLRREVSVLRAITRWFGPQGRPDDSRGGSEPGRGQR